VLPLGSLAATIALALIAGCLPRTNVLQVAPSSRGDSLVFLWTSTTEGRADGDRPYGLSVAPCGTERPVWLVTSDGTRSLPARVVYGETIPGFPTTVGPLPLAPGCYEASVSGSKPVRFDVDARGAVTPR
jgi:hypothetical protein